LLTEIEARAVVHGQLKIPRDNAVPDRDRGARNCILRATLDLNRIGSTAPVWTKNRSGNTLIMSCITGTLRFGSSVSGLGFALVFALGFELGQVMKFVTGLLAAVLLFAAVGTSHAVVRIADDRGGRIGTYVDKYQGLRSSGEMVVIDGLCASACTIVLGAVPHDKICVTSNANLGFHAAWDFGANGRAVTNPEATQMLYSMYPSQVRRWIAHRGGLTPRMIFLRGRQLAGMYKPCYMDAQARVD
jgi:hypothetical protein